MVLSSSSQAEVGMGSTTVNGHGDTEAGRPLVVKAALGSSSSSSSSAGGSGSSGLTKRITFSDSRKVSYEVLREKIALCFSLSRAPFRLAYSDDDGDETEISSDSDLSESIAYFASDADPASPKVPGSADAKITMRLHVMLQYNGPSLSDVASTAEGSSSWGPGRADSESWENMSGSSRADSEDYGSSFGSRRGPGSGFDSAEYAMGYEDGRRRGRKCRGGGRRHGHRGHWHHHGPDHHGPRHHGPGRHSPPPDFGPPMFGDGPGSMYGHHYPPPPPPPHMGGPHGPHPWHIGHPPPPPPPHDHRFGPGGPHCPPSSSGSSTSAFGSAPPGSYANGWAHPMRAQSDPQSNGAGSGSGSGSGAETVYRRDSDHTARSAHHFSPPSTGRSSPTSSLASAPVGRYSAGTRTPDLVSDTTSQSELDGPPSLVGGARERGLSPQTERGYPRPSSPSSATVSEADTPSEGRAPSEFSSAASRRLDALYPRPAGRLHMQQDGVSASSGYPGSAVSEDPVEMRDSALARLQISSRTSIVSRLSSAVPEELIRCCACREIMPSLRYICEVCGPIRPPSPLASDAGSTVDGDTGEPDVKISGERTEAGEEPFGRAADEVTEDGQSSASGGRRGMLDSSGYASSLESDDRQLEEGSDSTPPTSVDEDPRGYELCPSCVEHHGQAHAQAMVSRRESGEDIRDQTVRHAFEEVLRDEDGGWKEVEFQDEVHCTICGVGPLESNRFKCLSCARFDLCLPCYKRVHEIHPVHVFLAVPDKPVGPHHVASRYTNNQRLASWAHGLPVQARPPSPRRHEGIVCFECLGDIIGVRYSCSVCPSFDLCQRCEAANPAIVSPDGTHTLAHIMLKIPVPVDESQVADAQGRAQELANPPSSSSTAGRSARAASVNAELGSGIADFFRRPRLPPPWQPGFGRGGGGRGGFGRGGFGPFGGWGPPVAPPFARHGPPAPAPNVYLINGLGGQSAPVSLQSLDPAALQQHLASVVDHQVPCSACRHTITGNRWLCANCPTDPPYSLCSDCERSAAHQHDPMHAFVRVIYPLRKALPRVHALFPIIYAPPALARRHDSNGNEVELGTFHEANSVAHSNVICDLCLEPIRGAWYRCANCSESYDICGECAVSKPPNPQHDARHVWVKFVRRVDMSLFKDLVQLSTSTPRPLLGFSLYD